MDDKTKVGGPDRRRINLSENYEMEDWKRRFRVSSAELKEAVNAVGPVAADVEAYFRNKK